MNPWPDALIVMFAGVLIVGSVVAAATAVAASVLYRSVVLHEEVATRRMLGARRSQVVRRFLAENLIGIVAGVLGAVAVLRDVDGLILSAALVALAGLFGGWLAGWHAVRRTHSDSHGHFVSHLLLALLLCGVSPFSDAQPIASVVDPVIEKDIAGGVPGAAFIFVRDGKVIYQRGYGVSDLKTAARVDPERTVWPIASITKAVTAMGALQLVGDGRVKLDDDLNRYLKRVKVPAQGYAPLTLRHILSHTGALDEIPGRRYDGKQSPDMAAFLKDKLVRYREPGKLTAYSTYGVALAGVLIEDVSGQSYTDYLTQHIFKPAGMTSARIMMRQGDEKGVATPYEIDDGRASAIAYEWYATPPTSSMVATAADMGKLLLVHLANGRVGNSQLLSPQLTQAMHAQQATNHPDLPGWSLGFQLDKANGVHIVEHGGDIAGFSALFVLLPEKHEGFFIVNHGESGDLRFRVKQALLDAFYPAKPATVPTADAKNAPALAEYAGRYISSITCRTCTLSDDQVFIVKSQPNGTLSLWGQTWLPLRKDLFVRDDGKRMLGFARDEKNKIVSVTGGSWRVADRLQ